jgi:hypothetical protein
MRLRALSPSPCPADYLDFRAASLLHVSRTESSELRSSRSVSSGSFNFPNLIPTEWFTAEWNLKVLRPEQGECSSHPVQILVLWVLCSLFYALGDHTQAQTFAALRAQTRGPLEWMGTTQDTGHKICWGQQQIWVCKERKLLKWM